MTEEETRPSFKERLSALRVEIANGDWAPKGSMLMGKEGNKTLVQYISIAQMKAGIAPLFSKHGLEFYANMAHPEPIGSPSMPSGYMVRYDITIEDVYSDQSKDFVTYGYGTGDKAIPAAASYAIKSFFTNNYMVAERGDPGDDDDDCTTVVATYQPKTEKQYTAAKDQIKKAAEKTAAPPKAAPVAAPAAPAETAQDAGVEILKGIPKPQRDSIINLLKKEEEKCKNGEISAEDFETFKKTALGIKTGLEASQFIIAHRK